MGALLQEGAPVGRILAVEQVPQRAAVVPEAPRRLHSPLGRRCMDWAPRSCRGFAESAFRDPDGMGVYVRSLKKLR
jgi:hypothetical protein